jgi:transcriptional regulator with XRE-family HTH domain
MVNGPIVSPQQVRAARGWLKWSQDELSQRSGVSQGAIALYELERSVPHAATLQRLRQAFEAAGIQFQFVGMVGSGLYIARL